MSGPVVLPGHRWAACKCSHGHADHNREGFWPQCTASGCSCLQYRPSTAPQRPDLKATTNPQPREPSDDEVLRGRPPAIEQLLAAGKRSSSKRTVALAEKIALHVHDLRGRLSDEREAAEQKRRDEQAKQAVRQRISDLEKQLAEERAKIRGARIAQAETTPATSGEHACTRAGCDRTFATGQARAMHERRAHDGFNPTAPKAAAS